MKKIMFTSLSILVAVSTCFAKGKSSLAPDFKGVTATGDPIKLSDYRGNVVLLDFWASWCTPCQKEFPFLIELQNKNKNKDFVVIAINLDEDIADMKKFLAKINAKVPFPIVIDKEGKIPQKYEVEAMPTSVFIDKRGVIRYRHTGFKESHKREYVKELSKLLAEN